MIEKKDYTAFDNFIRARIRDGTLYTDMKEMQLREELKRLGIRRVKTFDEQGRGYVNPVYPTSKQLDRVKDIIGNKPIQEKIDKSIFYRHDKYGNRALTDLFYNDKKYKRGQFLPRKYGNE